MGKVGETLEEVEPHPMVLGIEARVVGYGGSTEEGGRRRRGLDGEGVPVVEGGREGAGKLRGVTVVLARGSEWAEELQRGGSTAVSSSPAFKVERRRRSELWERGNGKITRGLACGGICSAVARARGGQRLLPRACHRGGEVAAARAALRSVGARGTTGGGTARWQGRRGVSGRCVEATRSRRWRGEVALHGGRAAHGSGGEQAGKQAGEEDRDPNEISKISGAYLKNIDNY